LPQEWEFKLVDRNIRTVTETGKWADVVYLYNTMIIQKQVDRPNREAKQRGKIEFVDWWSLSSSAS